MWAFFFTLKQLIMKTFIIRGLPTFAHVEKVSEVSIEELLKHYGVQVRHSVGLGYVGEFCTALMDSNPRKRVSVYMQYDGTNAEEINKYCNDGQGGTYIRVNEDCKYTGGGSWSNISPCHAGDWFNVLPSNHPDYARAVAMAKHTARQRREAAERAEQHEEHMRSMINTSTEALIEKHGFTVALEKIRGLL